MAYPEVAPPALGKGDPGDKYRRPTQGVDPVHMIARLHAAEAQPARCADAAGPGAEDDKIGFHQAAAGGQGGIDIHRFKASSESMAAGDRAAEQPFFLQPGDIPAESKRQGCSIGHDIGNPAGGPEIFQYRNGWCDHAVQLTDKHRCFFEVFEAGQPLPAAGGILFAAEHAHLPGRIAQFHNMAAALKAGQRAAVVVFDKMISAAAERQVERSCIQQEQISRSYRAR